MSTSMLTNDVIISLLPPIRNTHILMCISYTKPQTFQPKWGNRMVGYEADAPSMDRGHHLGRTGRGRYFPIIDYQLTCICLFKFKRLPFPICFSIAVSINRGQGLMMSGLCQTSPICALHMNNSMLVHLPQIHPPKIAARLP